MKKNNKYTGQHSSSGRQPVSESQLESGEIQYDEENGMVQHQGEYASSHYRQYQGQNGSSGGQSPLNHSGKHSPLRHSHARQEDSSDGSNKNNKKSRIRQEKIQIKDSRASKHISKPSPRIQNTPIYQQDSNRSHKKSNERYNQEKEQDVSQLPEEEKMKALNANMEKLSDSLLDLRENYNKLEKDSSLIVSIKNGSLHQSRHSQELDLSSHIKSPSPPLKASKSKPLENSSHLLKKTEASVPKNSEEVLKFLYEKRKQKQERHKKLQKISEKERQKRQNEEKERQKEEKQFFEWRKSQIRQTAKNQQKNKKYKQKQQKGLSVLQQFLKKWDGKSYLHQVKQKQFKQKKSQQFKQKREEVITNKKEVYKPMNIQELAEHEKWFYAKRNELDQLKQAAADEKLHKIQQENAKLPERWKGYGHQLAAQERKNMKHKKKDPFERAKKIKEYQQHVRENFIPRGSKSQSAHQYQDSPFDPHKFMKVKRFRYYKGHSYGQIADTQPIAKDAEEIKRIGNSNMEIMKKIPKKRSHSPPASLVNAFTPQPERKFDMHMVHNIFSAVVEEHRQKQTKINLPQKIKREDINTLLDKLKSYDKRIDEKQKALSGQRHDEHHKQEQSELNKNMVDNIQRKLSVLSQL